MQITDLLTQWGADPPYTETIAWLKGIIVDLLRGLIRQHAQIGAIRWNSLFWKAKMKTLLSLILGSLGLYYLVSGKRRSKPNYIIYGAILIISSYVFF